MLHWTSVFPLESLPAIVRPELRLSAEHAADFSDAIFAETRGQSTLARILHHNFRAYLPEDLMVKVDRCSMAVSLETRSPLLDSGLIDFVGALPDSYKIRGTRMKRILRDTFEDLLAPVLLKRPKRGFGVPLAKWLDGPLRAQMQDHIRTESAEIFRYVDRAEVDRLLWSSPKLDAARALQAWTLWTLEVWLRGTRQASSEASS
jgi:asparagine synthase (glutamine-hydrolysing)